MICRILRWPSQSSHRSREAFQANLTIHQLEGRQLILSNEEDSRKETFDDRTDILNGPRMQTHTRF